MNKVESVVIENWSSDLIFLTENHFQKDNTTFWPPKLTRNFKNALFLSAYFKSVVIDMTETITEWPIAVLRFLNCEDSDSYVVDHHPENYDFFWIRNIKLLESTRYVGTV